MKRVKQAAAVNLEKSMLFIPNRLYARADELYVSFNIAVIPEDMDIVRLSLRLQLPECGEALSLSIHAIAEPWDEQSIGERLPRIDHQSSQIGFAPPSSPEPSFDVTHMADEWRRRSDCNHGLYVRLHGDAGGEAAFSEERPPYLLADTL